MDAPLEMRERRRKAEGGFTHGRVRREDAKPSSSWFFLRARKDYYQTEGKVRNRKHGNTNERSPKCLHLTL